MWLFAASSHAVCLLGQDILLLGSSAQVRNSRGCATLYAGAVGSSAACRTRCSDLCYYYLACGSRVGLRPDHIHTHIPMLDPGSSVCLSPALLPASAYGIMAIHTQQHSSQHSCSQALQPHHAQHMAACSSPKHKQTI